MKVEAEEEMHRWAGRTIIIARRRWPVIVGWWRGPGHVTGRRWHPIGIGTVFNVGELIRAPGQGGNKKQSECGEKANEKLFHGRL